MTVRAGAITGLLLFAFLSFSARALASAVSGTIDPSHAYAWGENIGWVNFGCDNCAVTVTDQELSGYAWSRQYGWIYLAPDTAGVTNDGEGVLSGYAWGSNLGWINFAGVTISATGEFSGYATVDSDGSRINFNCSSGGSCLASDFKVVTDWRPRSVRASTGGTISSGSRTSTPTPTLPATPPAPTSGIDVNPISHAADAVAHWFHIVFRGTENENNAEASIPAIAPLALSGRWNIIPASNIASFVFSPLPYEIRMLAMKFPELERTFGEFGIERLSDIGKLSGINFNVPSLADVLGKTINTVGLEEMAQLERLKGIELDLPGIPKPKELPSPEIGPGKIALIEGLPIAQFPVSAKRNLPAEFVFARAANETVDLGVKLAIDEDGSVTQKISALPGKTTKLIVKPISRARNVLGYIVFKSPTPKITRTFLERSSLTASALFSMEGLVEDALTVPVEKKLVLSSFEYMDSDGDGIYTADFIMPSVPGEYEIVTVIDYIDPELGSRKMSLITVIDPEGYVYEKNDGKETRIPGAVVSLYALNPSTGIYNLWNAEDYSQDNPQTTDIRGTYSFLVPAGSYYFRVEAPGYKAYKGSTFIVAEGDGIHMNIEMEPAGGIFPKFDVQSGLLIVIIILLSYNLYRNNLRNKPSLGSSHGTS